MKQATFRWLCAWLILLGSSATNAGLNFATLMATPVDIGSQLDLGEGPVGTTLQSAEMTLQANTDGPVININSLTVGAPFSLSGTCQAGTQLPNGETCTLRVAATSLAAGEVSEEVTINCSPVVAPLAGVTINCIDGAGSQYTLYNVVARFIGSLAPIPALDPDAMALLSLLLVLVAGWFGFRRQRR